MTDSAAMASRPLLQPSDRVRPTPVDGDALVDRLRLTAVSLGHALLMAPGAGAGHPLVLIPLGLVTVGFAPRPPASSRPPRRSPGCTAGSAVQLLGEPIPAATPTPPATARSPGR